MTSFLSASDRRALHELIRHAPNITVFRHAQALLEIDAGEAPSQVALRQGVARPTIYRWIWGFQKREGYDMVRRLSPKPSPGRPPRFQGHIESFIRRILLHPPIRLGYHATSWTAGLLAQSLRKQKGLAPSVFTVRRALHKMGYRWKRPRYRLSLRPKTWRLKKGV
jgi:transposase